MIHFKSVNKFRCLNVGPYRGQRIAHKVYFNNLFMVLKSLPQYSDVQIVSTSENTETMLFGLGILVRPS